MRLRITRRRPVAVVAVLTLLFVLLAAVQARADGEEDPTFGTAGTSFLSLDDVADVQSNSAMDIAPDGTRVTAIGVDLSEEIRGEGDEAIRLARLDDAGNPTGFGTNTEPIFDIDEIFDLRVLSDGTIVVVGEADDEDSPAPTRGAFLDGFNVMIFDADGELTDQRDYVAPDCMPDASPTTAQIGSDGTVYALWGDEEDSCEEQASGRGAEPEPTGGKVVEAFDQGLRQGVTLPDIMAEGTDVALGPEGDVFVLGQGTGGGGGGGGARGPAFEFSVVFRLASFLDLDEDYGNNPKVPGAFLSGAPVDLDVDQDGRALVWTDDVLPERGQQSADEGIWFIWRLDPEGGIDPEFDDDGVAIIEDERLGFPRCDCTESGKNSWLRHQSDGKVVALGLGPQEIFRGFPAGRRRTIIRLTEGGALDPSWNGDGVKELILPGDADEFPEWEEMHEPVRQADGKWLVPFFAEVETFDRVPQPPFFWSFGAVRLGLSPAAAETVVTPPPAAAGVAPTTVTVPSRQAPARTCRSRRQFRIRLRTGRRKAERSPIVSALVRVNGRKVTVTRRARRTSAVNLTNLPKGRFTVTIRLRLKDGGIVRETRRYRTCARKIERELGPLRTRPPRSKRR
jgi:hypothetical protein